MSFDIELARTATQVTITINDASEFSENDKTDLLAALLENKNLLRVCSPIGFLESNVENTLFEHTKTNIRALLEHASISVGYNSIDSNEKHTKDNFRFDDPSFYNATRIYFTKFNFDKNVPEADIKFEALKLFMLHELIKCRYMQNCTFYCKLDHTEPFLNQTEQNQVNHIINRNKHRNTKHRARWNVWAGIASGLIGLSAYFLIPGYGILSTLFSGAILFVGGINLGSAFSMLREHLLFRAGRNTLQQLKENTLPNDNSIKESLIVGLESKHWTGYFNSFLNFKTYTPKNYPAYAAGLYVGVNRIKEQKEAIKQLRVS